LETTSTFEGPEGFISPGQYELLPFRFARLPKIFGKVLVTSYVGEFLFLSEIEFARLMDIELDRNSPTYRALRTRQIVCDAERGPFLPGLEAQHATRKMLSSEDTGLHIFVVTLRCDHKCFYCQVTPRRVTEQGFDMDEVTAEAALDRVFESTAPVLTIEFQGGESALAFDRVCAIVKSAEVRVQSKNQKLRFVLSTTLHLLTEKMLEFCREHQFELSTSIDGPEHLHNANRPNSTRDSFQKSINGIARARAACGHERVAALTTITRRSLPLAREIIDTYVELGFDSISLRPLSPFGFAARSMGKIGYSSAEFLEFYRTSLAYLIELNLSGVIIEESYATLLLTRILTPFPTAYVDLQSPAAAGSSVLVYNYDGGVYVSDEGRMLAEMGDTQFRMGSVHDSLSKLRQSTAMKIVRDAGIAETLPGCADCAFVPYCGADPVFHVATQGDPIGHRPTSLFCERHMGLFHILFELLETQDPDVMRVFLSWIGRRDIRNIPLAGYAG